MAPKDALSTDGFEGEITGLGLSDIIQLNVQNRFSGCIDVHHEGRRGLIFLRNGDVIHAEEGALIGDAAFCEIVSWPGGRFTMQENVATTRSSIQKSCQFLILDAHRLMDERRAARRTDPVRSPASAPKPTSAAALMDRLRAIPGVVYAVLQGKDGARVGDDSYEAEVLAGQALYAAMMGRQLGERLQAGELHTAVVQGSTGHLLLFVAKNKLLAVLVDAEAQVGAVEAEVRKALSPGR